MEQGARDIWDSGDALEHYVGRWSRMVARAFLQWLGMPPHSRWLDVGCGPGALTETILSAASPIAVTGIDPSDQYIAFARARIKDSRVTLEVGDAMALAAQTATYNAAVAGLVLNFVPDADAAVAEMARVTRPGGLVGAYVWDYAVGMGLMRKFWDAAVALDPLAIELDEGRRFPLCRSQPLAQLFSGAGLREVQVRPIEIRTVFRDFDDYWSPFLEGQGPAPGYAMSLTEERRAKLRERIRSTLPFEPDGSIHLNARAWAVRGNH
jgi:SAM-dependent methyltransferase